MFPYPSGEGLHVGHPEGYTATDMYCRFQRMRGYNVLHPMGYDAFGLPAEQYAIQTGTHPRVTTERNIANIRRQIKRLGFSYDWDRELATTDPDYMRWTQWIFLVLFDTWFDPDFEWTDPDGGKRAAKGGRSRNCRSSGSIRAQGEEAVRRYQDSFRLAYQAESPVNWCPELGTVLADEEVINGRSERGDYPGSAHSAPAVDAAHHRLRRPAGRRSGNAALAGADQGDAAQLGRPQRRRRGRFFCRRARTPGTQTGAPGARRRAVSRTSRMPAAIRVYTTRPDTLFGATYMVLAPEHPLVDSSDAAGPASRGGRSTGERVATMSEEDRIAGRGEKSGVFTGGYATNPVTGERIPVWIADYVLISYGTGRHHGSARPRRARLRVRQEIQPRDSRRGHAAAKTGWPRMRHDPGGLRTSASPSCPRPSSTTATACSPRSAEVSLDGLPTAEAKAGPSPAGWCDAGLGRAAVKYKLRDWLFSRQRYWGEPIPILHELDADGKPTGLTRAGARGSSSPSCSPRWRISNPPGVPGGPLEKAVDWIRVREDGREWLRETNTMPQWAGSCWYYLRFCDPRNERAAWDPGRERYWMPVDLYVGGAEHAVLHLLYARFWHKVLFDRGHVSTLEPFRRLINQGMILSITYRTAEGRIVPYTQIKFGEGKAVHAETGEELAGETEKMSKSRGNVIPWTCRLQQYGADTTRLYEMFMGPLEDHQALEHAGSRRDQPVSESRLAHDRRRNADEAAAQPADPLRRGTRGRRHRRTAARPAQDHSGGHGGPGGPALQHGNQPPDGVRQLLHRPGCAARCLHGDVRADARAAGPASRGGTLAGSGTRRVAGLRALARLRREVHAGGHDRDAGPDQRPLAQPARGPLSISKEELETAALADPKVRKYLEGSTVRKVIVVPRKLINIVIS